jgi:hypothetical protein
MDVPRIAATAADPAFSRRRAVRIKAPPSLEVGLSDPKIKATIEDIGPGGMGLIADRPLSRSTVYTVRLQLGQDVVICGATAAHCRKQGDGTWIVGMSFVKDERFAQVERLMDALTGDLIQFS